jgi:hypothetical protein
MADPTGNGRILVDFSKLTLRDLARARVILEGRDPYELASGDEVVRLIAWCVRSRSQPDLSWDDALDIEVGDLQFPGAAPPPPTPTPDASGSSPARSVGRSSRKRQANSTPARSSAPTSTSPATSTSS